VGLCGWPVTPRLDDAFRLQAVGKGSGQTVEVVVHDDEPAGSHDDQPGSVEPHADSPVEWNVRQQRITQLREPNHEAVLGDVPWDRVDSVQFG